MKKLLGIDITRISNSELISNIFCSVDMVLHAWENPVPHTFVIITNDCDAAYAISMLRMRQYRVVLMVPAGTHEDLTAQASYILDWSRGALGVEGGVVDDFNDEHPTDQEPRGASPSSPPNPSTSGQSRANAAPRGTYDNEELLDDPPTQPYAPLVPPSAPFPSSRLRRGTVGGFSQTTDSPNVELHDLPSRGRRNSVFSKSYDVNFGAVSDAPFTTRPLSRGSFGFGDRPFFARSQSRGDGIRPDSAPGNVFYSTPPATSDTAGFKFDFRPSTKGKDREGPFPEPEDIEFHSLESPPRPTSTKLAYSGSIFDPFGEERSPFQLKHTSPPKSLPTRKDSVSTVGSVDSRFSIVDMPEPSTGLTSAQQEDDKFMDEKSTQTTSEATIKPLPSSMAAAATMGPSRRDSVSSQDSRRSDYSIKAGTLGGSKPLVKVEAEGTTQAVVNIPTPPPIQPSAPSLPATPLPPPSTKNQVIKPAATPTPIASSSTKPPQPKPPAVPQAKPNTPAPGPATITRVVPPDKWKHLVDTLRLKGGSSTPSALPALLLKTDPRPYQRAGYNRWAPYLNAAIVAGIVTSNDQRIQLTAVYA